MPAPPRIVIVGAGFGGLFAARALSRAEAEVIIVDRNNYHLFQPLLYQVATAALAPSDVAWPIRSILGRQSNCRVIMATVTGVDAENRQLQIGDQRLDYDYLVLSTGATHSWFGHDDWATNAPGLKDLDDATALRRRVLLALEQAEAEDDPDRIRRLLSFIVIGGGPTGVEMAGAIAELGRAALARDFRRIKADQLRVILIEAADRPLTAFRERLGQYTVDALEQLGVQVLCGRPVSDINADGVALPDEFIEAATVIWAAGVKATPVARWLAVEPDRGGRVAVDPDLRVPGQDRIFVIGDASSCHDEAGNNLPGVAPVAKQQGRYVADWISRLLAKREPPPPFRYRNYGLLATIGRSRAVADFGWIRFRGWIAWWVWGITHIFFLVGHRSPILVSLKWFWDYLTYQRGSRLITGRSFPVNDGSADD